VSGDLGMMCKEMASVYYTIYCLHIVTDKAPPPPPKKKIYLSLLDKKILKKKKKKKPTLQAT
jgi:hypothetical protein